MTEILPKAGGTLDQDPEFMRDLRIIVGVEANWEKVGKARASVRKQIDEATKGGSTKKGV